ncbi:hypothetical protein JCM19239_7967 [Vibrio variabilis]|uniref:Uncharacterized protein n=1 Tax=Vibrio variabilis TaxID=990271 RepID=A0ABQ0JGN9_9VIBR|nr:hypothetical protein JCM19239_7967 [Vibrio variabilis]
MPHRIDPNILLSHQIYWHHWQLESGVLSEVSDAIIGHARQFAAVTTKTFGQLSVSFAMFGNL